VSRKGGILGIGSTLVVSENIKTNNLVEIDISKTESISFAGQKANLVSVHPEDSYEWLEEEDGLVLDINNPEEFWNGSKYLVIVSRP
jgi:hypothetical protein